ncbi:TolC family protein [Aquimarina rhabdastrellae]
MNLKHIYITIGIVVYSFSCNAQELLTKEKAIEIALQHNYDIQIAKNDLEVADNNKGILNSGYLPTITGSSGANYNKGNSESEFPDGTVNEIDGYTSKSYNASIGVNYTLFDGFNRKYTYQKFKEQYKLTELQVRQVVENTIVTLYTHYHEVARLTENEKNQKGSLSISKERLKRAKYAFEYGQNTKLNVLNAQVDVNNDSIAYLDVNRQLANAKRNLNVILGRDIKTETIVDTTITYEQELVLDKLMKNALENNVALLQTEKNINLSNYDIKINKAGWLPNVSLSSSYTWSKSDNDALNQFSATGSTQYGINAGVNMSWNIFDGGKTKTRVNNAKITIDTQEIKKEQQEEQLKRDVANAWETYQNALFTLKVQESNVETNAHNFERTNELFKLGQVTSIDFRQAQNNQLNAIFELSKAKYEAKNAELQLMLLSGTLLK